VTKFLSIFSGDLPLESNDSHRPWGFFENLVDADNHKVKRITVYPGKRLSLQSHDRRAEHWFIVDGNALFTRNDKEIKIKPGQAVDIGRMDKHRIENIGTKNLVFIEIQTGDYFGEDDITRFEDDFGRS
jgi:mannose-6-phosphate isomerase